MIAIIGVFLGMFGLIFAGAIGNLLSILFLFAGAFLIWKQMYVDQIEEELERRDLGYEPRKFHRKNLTAWLDDWTEAKE